jgi:hypothetical protein
LAVSVRISPCTIHIRKEQSPGHRRNNTDDRELALCLGHGCFLLLGKRINLFFTRIAEEKIRKELNLYKLQVLEKYHIYYIIDNKYGELYNLKLKE